MSVWFFLSKIYKSQDILDEKQLAHSFVRYLFERVLQKKSALI